MRHEISQAAPGLCLISMEMHVYCSEGFWESLPLCPFHLRPSEPILGALLTVEVMNSSASCWSDVFVFADLIPTGTTGA